ncbi:hypothetical protein EDD15DRAFT_2447662 [Pisolithus albus]|nr:hypothetical protein EDD15DRAFT_2447662 [Pisolithus albus]
MADMDVFAAMGISGFGKAAKKRELDPSRFDKMKRMDSSVVSHFLIIPKPPPHGQPSSVASRPIPGPSRSSTKVGVPAGESEEEDKEGDDFKPWTSGQEDPSRVSDSGDFPVTHEATLKEHTKVISALALDPSGARVLSGSYDYDCKLWDFGGMTTQTRSFKTWEPAGSYYVNDLKYSNDGQQFLVISATIQAKLYDRDGEEKATFIKGDMYIRDMKHTAGHVGELSSCAWHPRDRQYFITSSADSTIRVWDVENKRKQKSVIVVKSKERGARTKVTTCAYSPDGNLISGACLDGCLHLWNASSNFVRPNMTVEEAHTKGSDVGSIAFSVDGRTVLTRGGDETVKLWDLRSFKKPLAVRSGLATLYPGTNAVFSPDEKHILTSHGASEKGGRGKLVFLRRSDLSIAEETDMETTPVKVLWHSKINQILTGLSNGTISVLYSPVTSINGAKLLLAKGAPKRPTVEDLSDALAAPAILTPHALPMFRDGDGVVKGTKRRREKDRMDPRKSRRPELPVTGPGKGGRVGASATQHIVQNLVRDTTRDEDPREALLKYAKLTQEDPVWTADPMGGFRFPKSKISLPLSANVTLRDSHVTRLPMNATDAERHPPPTISKDDKARRASLQTECPTCSPLHDDVLSEQRPFIHGDPSEDVKMADPSPIVDERPVADVSSAKSCATSGDPGEPTLTTNGINGHSVDADGDVTMAQPSPPPVNGQTTLTDGEGGPSPPAPISPPVAASASPSHAETDDDTRPPPAKRARKFSDADQASVAHTASPPPVTASSTQTDGDQVVGSPAPPSAVVSSSVSTLSAAQHRFCLSTIRSLRKLKDAAPFLHPVDPIALNIPHYPSIIKNPMDLSTIERKLMSSNPTKPDPNPNNPRYNSADEFIADVRKHVEGVFDKQIKQLPPPAPIKPTITKTATPPPPPQPVQPKKAPAPLRRASASVPVIRRNDTEHVATARPKREIHPPPPKDLPYADAPKRLRKPKVKDDGTAEQLRFCGKILTDLHGKRHWAIAHPFYEPVDPVKLDIPMYPKIIKKPMDLSTMRKKLDNGEYSNATKFFEDFKLMIRNCFTFNPAGTPVNQAGIELQRLFDEKWKNLPQIQDASEEDEEDEDESEEERKRRIANIEAQIESMRGNLLALKNQPGKEKEKKRKKKEKPSTASTSKASGSRVPKAANAANGTVKKKSKKQIQDDDILTFEQKKDLSEAISSLDESKLEKVIQIIHEGVPDLRDSTEEIELEIDLLPAHVLTKLYNFVIRPLRQPAQKRSRGTGKGTGTGGLKRKSMDENIEAEKIRQLEERIRLFEQPNSGATSVPLPPMSRADDSERSSDSSSDDSSGSESE